jgi:predicted PurR-regulated permease PerM
LFEDREKAGENKMNDDRFVLGRKSKKILWTLSVIILVLLIVFLVQRTELPGVLGVVLNSLQALLFGLVFACLLAPMASALENCIKKLISRPDKPRENAARIISVILSVVILVAAIVTILFIVIPQIGITLNKMMPEFGKMISGFNSWVKGLSDSPIWQERIYPAISDFANNIASWILGNIGVGTDLYKIFTTGIAVAFGMVVNFLVGLIMAMYMLIEKEKLFAQIKKLNKAVFKEKIGSFVTDSVEEAVRIFSGFFGAKILEAILMGVITFFVMLIFRWPYATLISVMVGAANIIPFFGPYIGTIIGAAVIVLVNPMQALGFIIFQIILIQFDANFMGPKILGHKTGLSAFWVIVAILLFSGSFGIIGAFIGVPVFAWIYYMVKHLAELSLKKQGLPVETDEYYEDQNAEEKKDI